MIYCVNYDNRKNFKQILTATLALLFSLSR